MLTKEDKVILLHWFIHNYLPCGSVQTLAKNTNDIKQLESYIQHDEWHFQCDRCIHGGNVWCDYRTRPENQIEYPSCFRFRYKYWKNYLEKTNQWEKVKEEYKA